MSIINIRRMTSNFVKFAQRNFPLPISTSQFTHFGAHVNSMELRMSCDVKELRCQGAAISELQPLTSCIYKLEPPTNKPCKLHIYIYIYILYYLSFIISQNELKVNSCGAHFSIHKKFSITIDFFQKICYNYL